MRNSKEPALNPDLWERLLGLCEKHQVTFIWLKGHAGTVENERCDQLAMQSLLQKDLPADEGYENKPEVGEPVRITQEGRPCRKCGTPVVKRKPCKAPQFGQELTVEYYLYCPQCGTSYTVGDAKKTIQPPRLF